MTSELATTSELAMTSADIPDLMPELMTIGYIVNPQGLKGDVRVFPETDFPARFLKPGPRWMKRKGSPTAEPIELVSGRFLDNKGLYVLHFEGIDDRDKAEDLRGAELLVPESERVPLPKGQFHILDLIGLAVVVQATGETIGTITDVMSLGNDLLQVKRVEKPIVEGEAPSSRPSTPLLIPFVEAIVPVVDVPGGKVEITPPPGLLDL
jgi:16S rRNA processing protein RimM